MAYVIGDFSFETEEEYAFVQEVLDSMMSEDEE